MSDAERTTALVWGRIIDEVRRMREEKYTLERIGGVLGVAKPTVQRWLENGAGGEKTAFIDILRYLKALDLDLRELLYGREDADREDALRAELAGAGAERERLALELVDAQRELLASRQRVIELQDKIIGLERLNAEIADKARKAIVAAAAAAGKRAAAVPAPAAEPATPSPAPAQVAQEGRRRLDPSRFPDLPPIHLHQGK